MRRITLIFALLLSLMGVKSAWADNADFENALPEGWEAVGTMDYYIDRAKTGDYSIGNSSGSGWDTNRGNYIKTTVLEGDVTFWIRSYKGNTTGYVVLFKLNDDGTVGDKLQAFSSSSTTFAEKSYTLTEPTALAIVINYAHLDNMTYTEKVTVNGPALKVTGDDNGSLNFGMVNPGATKDLTLSNPGTQDITVNITTTGGFTTDVSKTITAGGKVTLSIAAPDKTGTGTVTITPSVTTVEAVTINLSCTVKDPAKVYEYGFTALPEDWTTTGSWYYSEANGAYTTSWFLSSNARLITPLLVISEGETFIVEAKGYSTSNTDYQHLQMQYSADGSTWTNFDAEPTLDPSEWNTYTFTGVPAGKYYIAINASQADIRMFYGGELDQTPRPKLEVEGIANGGSLSWGYSDVPAGSTKTITLKNDGTADLDVTIAATDDYTVDPATATIEAGGTAVVTIGTPAHDGEGVLTITPAEGSGLSPYTINLTSYYKEPKPVMAIDKTSVAFGKVNEVKSETITVSNTGDAELVVAIANDNTTNFTVVPAESLTVAPGETGEFTITYNYVEGTWGTFKANVTVTPNYGGTYDVKTITVSATSKDPNVWSEDFEEGTLPTTWNNEGGWTVSEPTASGSNGSYMATISSYNNPKSLTTPRLEAKAGETLTFYVGMQYDDEPLTIEYTNDEAKAAWTPVVEPVIASGEITFTAPADGFYYIRFTGTYAMLDDFNGFKLAMKDHEIEISGSNIPAEGTQFAEYTATATVKELVGVEEGATAKLYVNGEEVAAATETVAANGTATFTLTYVPEEAIENAVAKIIVTYAGGELATEEVTINIAAAPVLDETVASEITTGTVDALVLKYTPKVGWNTICLPFALTSDILTQIFGEGWKAYEFSAYTDGALSFRPATSFYAGYPYIVYSEAPVANENGFVVNNVNVSAATANADTYGGATFQGTYDPIAAPGMEGKYGVVTSTGKIQKGSAKASLKGLRAYFELPAGTPVKELGISYEDDATGISQVVATPENGAIYDLNGNKVKNLVKGQVYIMNGQKVLIK